MINLVVGVFKQPALKTAIHPVTEPLWLKLKDTNMEHNIVPAYKLVRTTIQLTTYTYPTNIVPKLNHWISQ